MHDQGEISADRPHVRSQLVTRGAEGGLGVLIVTELSSESGAYDNDVGEHVVWFRIGWTGGGGASGR